MEVRGIGTPRLEWAGDCLVIGLFEDAIALPPHLFH
jgi:leucyl aminopeptidase